MRSLVYLLVPGYPRHMENRENGQKKSLSLSVRENTGNLEILSNTGNLEILSNTGKTQGILSKHRENTGKTQGILLAQVVNVLILKVKDIAIVAAKKIFFFFPEAE